jgi:DNA-binding beta-propeller fold protein YncE
MLWLTLRGALCERGDYCSAKNSGDWPVRNALLYSLLRTIVKRLARAYNIRRMSKRPYVLPLLPVRRPSEAVALVVHRRPQMAIVRISPSTRRWRDLGLLALTVFFSLTFSGCDDDAPSTGRLEKVWGRRGVDEGRLQKPRAMTIDSQDHLYIVDMTGRIQVFDDEGEYLRGWRTPEVENGKPTGLSFDLQGNLLVADTHYFRVLTYTPLGQLLSDQTIGGTCGHGPGEFGFVTEALQDSKGNYYVSEYGEWDRIQKFSPDRRFLFQWGGHGSEPGKFIRPQSMAVDGQDRIWVADACNHRIQVFDATGTEARLLQIWGEQGKEPGKLSYPYDLILDGKGHLYVSEFGNSRVQKFTLDGRSLGCWGTPGRRDGELNQPWALVMDSKQRLHVLDTYNHRVQRIRF